MQQFEVIFADVVARLQTHFHDVVIRQAPDPSHLSRRLSRFPSVPDHLLRFYALCNGIEVFDDEDGDIFSIDSLFGRYPVCSAPNCARLLPIRGDGCGDYDCVVAGPGPCSGAVVFWDHEVDEGPVYLLGGTLGGYLSMWADNLLTEHSRDGTRLPQAIPPRLDAWPWFGKPQLQHPWPFDEAWLRASDAAADHMLGDPTQRSWLLRQDEE